MKYFIIAILVTVILSICYMSYRLGGFNKLIKYFSTDSGKKVLKGIVLFILFGLSCIFASKVFADDIKYFDYGKVYLGLDYPNDKSPMCLSDNIDDRVTSNGGLIVNIMKADRFEFNAKYTHHSCAFNSDETVYNAAGISFEYYLW